MNNTDELIEAILLKIDRLVKLSNLSGIKLNKEKIDRLSNEFIKLLKTDLGIDEQDN